MEHNAEMYLADPVCRNHMFIVTSGLGCDISVPFQPLLCKSTAPSKHSRLEDQMKTALITLALLSLTLAGCIVDPGRDYGNHGWDNGGHGEYHAEHAQQGDWNR
jgi:hypothetical protein